MDKIDRINAINPDLAIEVHLNSNEDSSYSGHEFLYYPTSKSGKYVAEKLLEWHSYYWNRPFCDGLSPRSDLAFLKYTKCPAVITEQLFLSNDKEAKHLKELNFSHTTMAWALMLAIDDIVKGRP